MRFLFSILFSGLLLLHGAGASLAEIRVVASIKPVHSLVAAIMQGAGSPEMIVAGAASPHHYGLRPSQAELLQRADIVFWVGPGMETFLAGPIDAIAAQARPVALIEDEHVRKLDFRASPGAEVHEDEHESEDEHGHDHLGTDGHIWLDPINAVAMVNRIGAALANADPENAARYKANASALLERLTELDREIAALLEPVRRNPFIVFHDAYQYFEKRYELTMAGAITAGPEISPGADRVRTLRNRIIEAKAGCVFSEPQFDPKLVAILVEGTEARTAVLDPLGADLEDGPELYFQLMRDMAQSFRACLQE